MSTTRVRRLFAIALTALALLASCGDSAKVGTEVGAAGGGSGEGALRDSDAPTTTAADGGGGQTDAPQPQAPPTTIQRVGQAGGGTATTQPPAQAPPQTTPTTAPPVTTTAPKAQEFTVRLGGEQVGQGEPIDPQTLQVPQGALVTFVNETTKERRVVSDTTDSSGNPVLNSPNIAAGKSWTWTANVNPQTIEYRDITRSFTHAVIQVY